MSKVILHIGTHKTATTAIQTTFSLNADLLARHGVIYPQLGIGTGHHGLVCDWAPHLSPTYDLPGGSRRALRQLGEAYGKGDDTVFLSSEEFSRGTPGYEVDFAEVRDLLAAFDEIEVICVVRQQWQFLQSVYLEVAKNSTTPHPTTFAEDAIGLGLGGALWSDYNLLYNHLLTTFAPEQITLLEFERCRSQPGGMIAAMLARLSTDLTIEQLEMVDDGLANPSLPPLPTWAATVIAAPDVASPWLIECTTNAFRTEFGADAGSSIFSLNEYNNLARHFLPLNAKLTSRRRPFQPDFTLEFAIDMPDLIFRNQLTPSFWMHCSRSIYAQKQGLPLPMEDMGTKL